MNSNLYKACLAAEEEWFGSMELIEGEHKFSTGFERKMKRLIDKMRNDKYHHLTKRATRTLIIAAIIVAIATTVFATPRSREYIIEKFNDYSKYTVKDGYEGSIDDLSVGYIPDGFELVYQTNDTEIGLIICEYDKDDLCFMINKTNDFGYVFFDTEYGNEEKFIDDNVEYIYYSDLDGLNGLVWNSSDFEYYINGNIDKDTMIKIAKSIK